MVVRYMKAEIDEKLESIDAVIFDWAGTTIDFGCMAPTRVFREIFRTSGVDVTEAEARGPMGLAKIDHIRTMLAYERVQQLWQSVKGRPSNDADVQQLYESFLPLQKSVLAQHADIIPGILEMINDLRERGIKIGSTTGYTRELMQVVMPIAQSKGYLPEVTVCSDEVVEGRPAPWQIYNAAQQLRVYPMSTVMIVDDSIAGIRAGQAAGCITVAVAVTGNAMGLGLDEWRDTTLVDRESKIASIVNEFRVAGTDIILDSAADLCLLWD